MKATRNGFEDREDHQAPFTLHRHSAIVDGKYQKNWHFIGSDSKGDEWDLNQVPV